MNTLRTIATQAQLSTVNFELSQLIDNLAAHANDDQSDSHGLNFVNGPSNDANGNDLSYYGDVNGDVVGTFQVGFLVNDQRVYVPAKITTLDGKPSTTGLTVTPVTDAESGAGASSWVTNFDDDLTGLVQTILEQYLLPHTQLAYWEAHGGLMFVNPELAHKGPVGSGSGAGWLDSSLHLVASASLRLKVDGLLISIPCSTRVGGPPQQVKILPFSPPNIYYEITGPANYNLSIFPVTAGGTKPFTYAYKYVDNLGGWHDIAPNTVVNVPLNYQTSHTASGEVMSVSYSSTTGQFVFYSASGPVDHGVLVNIAVRVVITAVSNPANEFTTTGGYPVFEISIRNVA